jgi:uncharacterized membrane protein
LVLGLWGGLLSQRRFRGVGKVLFAATIIAALVFALLIRFPDDAAYGQRTGALLLFVTLLLGLTRFSIDDLESSGRWGWAVLIAVGFAIPTVVFDFYTVAGTTNPETRLLVHPADRAAAEWSHEFIPETAIMQSHPSYAGGSEGDSALAATLSWGTDIAFRPIAAGPSRLAFNLPDSTVRARTHAAIAMLSASHPDSTAARAERLGIEYIYCGPNEMNRYPRLRARLSASPDLFEPVYETDSAGIYRVYLRTTDE